MAAATCLGLVSLNACGSSGEGMTPTPTPYDPARAAFLTAGTDALAQFTRLDGRLPTNDRNIPDVGQVTYSGASLISVDTATESTLLIGQASVVADFTANSMSGSMSNFVGGTRPVGAAPDAATTDYARYDGSLTLDNGIIVSVGPIDFVVDFSGTLTGNGDQIVLSGTMPGEFRGNPGIAGVLAETPLGSATVNGVATDAIVGFYAEDPF